MKKIKKQHLSLQSTVVRDLSSNELATVAGGSDVCVIIKTQETVVGCGNCTGYFSGCIIKKV